MGFIEIYNTINKNINEFSINKVAYKSYKKNK